VGRITVDRRTDVHRSIRPDTVGPKSPVDAAAGGEGRSDRNRNEKDFEEALPVHCLKENTEDGKIEDRIQKSEYRTVSVPVASTVPDCRILTSVFSIRLADNHFCC